MQLKVTVEVEGGVVTEVYLVDQETGKTVDFELVVDDHDMEGAEEDDDEENRRDEKHGLYGEHEDPAN
jgi:hypothetical protein